jgi:hypothetical protein
MADFVAAALALGSRLQHLRREREDQWPAEGHARLAREHERARASFLRAFEVPLHEPRFGEHAEQQRLVAAGAERLRQRERA